MDFFANIALGIQTAVSPMNLVYCLVGALIGTLIGVLPGIGPVQTIAILMPTTFALPPVSALIMLSGIYYGAQYGGSTTSILVACSFGLWDSWYRRHCWWSSPAWPATSSAGKKLS